MVIVIVKTGPDAGSIRTNREDPTVNPEMFFVGLARNGWKWEVDWTTATQREVLEWLPHEVVGRIFLAAYDRRAVRVGGTRWNFATIKGTKAVATALCEIDDAIAKFAFFSHEAPDGGDVVVYPINQWPQQNGVPGRPGA